MVNVTEGVMIYKAWMNVHMEHIKRVRTILRHYGKVSIHGQKTQVISKGYSPEVNSICEYVDWKCTATTMMRQYRQQQNNI